MTIHTDRIVDSTKSAPDLGRMLKTSAYQQGHFVYIDETHVLDQHQHTENRLTIINLAGAIVVGNNGSTPVPFTMSFERTYFVGSDEQQIPTTALTQLTVGEGTNAAPAEAPVRGHDAPMVGHALQRIVDAARKCNVIDTRDTVIKQQLIDTFAEARNKQNHGVALDTVEFLHGAADEGACTATAHMYGKISIDHNSAYVPFKITCDINITDDDEVVGMNIFGVHVTDDDKKLIHTDIDRNLPSLHIIDCPRAALSSAIYLLAMTAEEYLRTV
mgnify:CR=1 FL=1